MLLEAKGPSGIPCCAIEGPRVFAFGSIRRSTFCPFVADREDSQGTSFEGGAGSNAGLSQAERIDRFSGSVIKLDVRPSAKAALTRENMKVPHTSIASSPLIISSSIVWPRLLMPITFDYFAFFHASSVWVNPCAGVDDVGFVYVSTSSVIAVISRF
jgi:hypothetical protein